MVPRALKTPAEIAYFVSVYNAARCPVDVARLLGITVSQVHNRREWLRRKGYKLKRFREPPVAGGRRKKAEAGA